MFVEQNDTGTQSNPGTAKAGCKAALGGSDLGASGLTVGRTGSGRETSPEVRAFSLSELIVVAMIRACSLKNR
ncbi:hypothetical protein TMatcc_004300 [Talaromyces marneffei ATCC 18224]